MPARWLSSECRATTTSVFESAKKASRACELCAVSRRISRVGWRRSGPGAGRGPLARCRLRSASQPTTAGASAAIVIPTIAIVWVGRQRMNATPITSRGMPSAR